MTSHDWNSLRRSRWTTVALIVVAAAVLLFLRSNQHQNLSRGWGLYSIGYVLTTSETPQLVQTAPWLHLPDTLAGLTYGGAVVHPEGARGIAFVELLYGSMSDRYLDVSESQTPLSVGITGHLQRFGATSARVGSVVLRGVRRQFALMRHGGVYYLVVAPAGSGDLSRAVVALAR